MTTQDNGGPAFPTVDANRYEDYGTKGMTLRDYFAAKAMHGMWTNPNMKADYLRDHATKDAYSFADKMLLERSKAAQEPKP